MYCWDKIVFNASLSCSSALHQAVNEMKQMVPSPISGAERHFACKTEVDF